MTTETGAPGYHALGDDIDELDEIAAHERAISKSERARRILADPLVLEAFDEIKQGYIDGLLAIERDAVAMFRMRDAILVVDTVKKHLEQYVSNGEFSAKMLKQIKKPRDRFSLVR